ncbi:MAG: hypothetical protein V3T76_08755, partial [candidate division NC10 bacterium]
MPEWIGDAAPWIGGIVAILGYAFWLGRLSERLTGVQKQVEMLQALITTRQTPIAAESRVQVIQIPHIQPLQIEPE